MIRKHATTLLAAVAMQASLAHGLGLGSIALQSGLDQPLDATIRLRGVGDLNAGQISVGLGSDIDFSRAGVDRLPLLNEIRFEIELGTGDEGVLHLRTERPVKEPYLDFVVEVRWPSGRVLREYTVLLDPVGEPAFTPAPEAAPAPVARQSRAAAAVGDGGGDWNGDDWTVRQNDTMWRIASRVRPAGVSVQQMMVAIQRSNPDAFIRGNINLLRAGQVLRIPAGADIEGLTQAEAVNRISEQASDWQGGEREPPAAAAPVESEPAPAAAATDDAYLRLSGDQAAATGDGAPAALQDELAATQENLTAAEREKAELAARVSALEEQVKNYERLVELKGEAAATAQDAAAAVSEAKAEAAEPAAPAAASAPAPKASPRPATPEPGLVDRLLSNTLVLVGIVAALVMGAVGFLVMRRRSGGTYASVPEPEQRYTKAPVARETRTDTGATTIGLPEDSAAAMRAKAAAVSAEEREESDPVSEAEIYLAYGQHLRAVELLRSALARDAAQAAVHLKLLEIFLEQGDRDAFLAQFDALAANGGPDDVDAAREMLAHSAYGSWMETAPAADDYETAIAAPAAELDSDWAPPASVAMEPEPVAAEFAGFDLADEPAAPATGTGAVDEIELDLGELAFDDADSMPAELPAPEEAEADMSLHDLDVDLGELEFEAPAEAVAAAEPVYATAPLAQAAAADDDADLAFLADSDEIETKIELARAYIDMGDVQGARDILAEVLAEGAQNQRDQAADLLDQLRDR